MNFGKASTCISAFLVLTLLLAGFRRAGNKSASDSSLWPVYEQYFKDAKYVDLSHRITPSIPVWHGFGPSKFTPAVDPATTRPYTYAKDGFEATHYDLSTDQLGTQLDPPAHWNPYYPAIDELPPTYTIRPLVVIPIQDKVAKDPGYQMTVDDIRVWEQRNGRIPEGSVVFIRSDWSKRWPDPKLAEEKKFPGVTLAALKFLHLQRHILFHGHEPLDTDDTPTLEGEAWLLRSGYTQAEGVAHLDEVPEKGALVAMGFPKLEGGTGGYARYIAICPPDWKYGVSVGRWRKRRWRGSPGRCIGTRELECACGRLAVYSPSKELRRRKSPELFGSFSESNLRYEGGETRHGTDMENVICDFRQRPHWELWFFCWLAR